MTRILLRRFAGSVGLLLAVLVFVFLLILAAPGDPVAYLVGDQSSPELYQETRIRFGLDRSPPERLWAYLSQTATGNLGYSYAFGRPVIDVVLQRIPNTLFLGGSALLLSVLVGVPLGVYIAFRSGGRVDRAASALVLVGFSVPVFWVGMLAIVFFAVRLGWFPAQGAQSLGVQGLPAEIIDRLHHVVLPATTLALTHLAVIMAVTRAKVLEMMHTDFFLGARAKGLSAGQALVRHALRNALIPVVTVVGYDFAQIMSGAILTETVFAWPGMGRLVYEGVLARDYPLITGSFVIFTAVAVTINFLTDLTYLLLDPRIRYERRP